MTWSPLLSARCSPVSTRSSIWDASLASTTGCGSRDGPRPLHHQRLLNREITVTERLDMHLLWGNGRIFIKPLPRFLLEPRFWEHLGCKHPPNTLADDLCAYAPSRQRALGLLFSYAALIVHESDFHIARENHLLPQEVQWQAWRTAIREVLDTKHSA